MDLTSFFATVDLIVSWGVVVYSGLIVLDVLAQGLGRANGFSLKVRNITPMAIILLFVAKAILLPLSLGEIGVNTLLATGVLAVGIVLFTRNYVGAGVVKLFAASLLYLGPGYLSNTFGVSAAIMLGGFLVVTIVLKIMHKIIESHKG